MGSIITAYLEGNKWKKALTVYDIINTWFPLAFCLQHGEDTYNAMDAFRSSYGRSSSYGRGL